MLPDHRDVLMYERQDRLLCETADERLARLAPQERRLSPRERVAGALIALALHIAPSMRNARHTSLTVHG